MTNQCVNPSVNTGTLLNKLSNTLNGVLVHLLSCCLTATPKFL